MQKRHVILGSYNHLPEGEDESAFEERYQVCWRPWLSVLYRFPDIASVISYSGTVLRWLETRHPEFLMLLEEMVARKQVELLGGGFFAPLLPLVPSPDRLGQIEMLTTWIRKSFGRRPRGCWIQEYAWEPVLVSNLQACGFEYCFHLEREFRIADAPLDQPALSEDQGKCLTVFPVFDAGESFPAPLAPEEALAAVESRHGELPLVTLFYPDRCARELWLRSGLESPDVFFERSFAALQRESLAYETTTPGRWLKNPHRGARAYFPGSASSFLLSRSVSPVLPLAASGELRDARAGSPRRVLLRYEESNALYARMQFVRILVGQLRGDKSRKKSAQEEVWRAQCGEAYWYGSMGGLLRLPVRAAAWSALIEAEKMTRLRGSFSPGLIKADIDLDGEKEVLYMGSDFNATIHPRGAVLAELDSMRSLTNYVNALGPEWKREGHAGRRGASRCFHDHIFDRGSFGGERGAFLESNYNLAETDPKAMSAVFTKEGRAEMEAGSRALSLRKRFAFRRGQLCVDYELANLDDTEVAIRFATELNLTAGHSPSATTLAIGRGHEREDRDVEAAWIEGGLSAWRIENRKAGECLEIRSDLPFELSHSPLWRGVEIEGEYQEQYQGARFLAGWDLSLPPGSSLRFSLCVEIGRS